MTVPPVTLSQAPVRGLWRLGWSEDPVKYNQVEPETFDGSSAGRFSLFSYGTLYCASDPAGCYAEALEQFRVSPRMRRWMTEGPPPKGTHMSVGDIASSWRDNRILVRLTTSPEAQFLDLEADATRSVLLDELGEDLKAFGVGDSLTDKHLRGRDRRITRQIAAWAVAQRNERGHQLVQGITYRSGYAGYQCWAIWRDTELHEQERCPIKKEDRALREVADEYGLRIR
ncbi:RES domain-containing protein [Streptomyces sp. gb14]|uniref:RES domain-containing protein n=1 Tax=Streptomyces sp. gb14 TaxID=1827753 RepID=UPI000BF21B40|nr:RES domain-containing protein [Streptomyces sp. gb14]